MENERRTLARSFLGKSVHIKIDRPIGYVHQKNGYSLSYPLNYGYIPDVFGGDDEELDVYLLGISVPVSEYTAEVIGIVHRKNDVEDKLLAAPHGMDFTKEEVEQAVHFQEQYYDTAIELYTPACKIIRQYNKIYSDPPERVRVSCRAFVIDKDKLLFSHEVNKNVYMSPGGGLEDGETLSECCAREVSEETGYIVRPIKKFLVVNEYSFETLYISHYFVCEIIGKGEAHLTETEIDHGITPAWLSFDEALSVFGTYESKQLDHRSLYLREYTVLQKYLKEIK